MNLTHLSDKTLIHETEKLVKEERRVLNLLLHHLQEIDSRKLFSELGFKSLFDYLTRGLSYSESSAQRRIAAARLLMKHPEIEKKLIDGQITMTLLGLAACLFKQEQLNTPLQKEVLKAIEGKTTREAQKTIFQMTRKDLTQRDQVKMTSSEKFELKISIDNETERMLQELKALSDEENLGVLLKQVLRVAIDQKKKKQFHLTEKPRTPSAPKVNKRSPTASQKREIFIRDQRCVKCKSIFRLQIDHKKPYALGGKTQSQNLRLLCFHCNQRERIRAGL